MRKPTLNSSKPLEPATEAATSPLWDTRQSAGYLLLSARTLEYYRMTGGGPRYARSGRKVVYRKADLDKWLDSRSFENTSEAKRAFA
jgi:hypothetical protein